MRQRYRRDGNAFAPEQNQRRTTECREHRRAEHRCNQQKSECRPFHFLRRDRYPKRNGNKRRDENQSQHSATPSFCRVPPQAKRNDSETDRQQQLHIPRPDPEGDDVGCLAHIFHKDYASRAQECRHRRGKRLTESQHRIFCATMDDGGERG